MKKGLFAMAGIIIIGAAAIVLWGHTKQTTSHTAQQDSILIRTNATVTGEVVDIFPGAHSVMIRDAGGKEIALAVVSETKLSDMQGAAIDITTIGRGSTIEAKGESSGRSAIVASNIIVIKPQDSAIASSTTTLYKSSPRINVFFTNSNLDPALICDTVFPLNRAMTRPVATKEPAATGTSDLSTDARAALEELLKGPNQAEKSDGYFTNIGPGVSIRTISIENETARVDLSLELERGMTDACRTTAIRMQIAETLKQFPSIRKVVISVGGNTESILNQ